MKTKFTNSLSLSFILVVIMCCFSSCMTDQQVKGYNEYNQQRVDHLKNVLITVEIDSCEYLVGHVPGGGYGWVMTHKGNCKFCAARVRNLSK